MGVPVSVLLERKGPALETIGPDATLGDAAERLAARNIGAIVVTHADGTLAGILSERDIVHRLATSGPRVVDLFVSEAMTREVETCGPTTNTDHLMRTMTDRRVRHIPVVDGEGRLVGIVSIGDVVKWQLEELSSSKEQLEAYVTGGSY